MSHINITMPDIGSGKRSIMKCGSFDKGVSFCRYDRELLEGQSPYMKNLIYDGNMLRTRQGRYSMGFDGQMPGQIHSGYEELFFGRSVFHIGTGLYSFDGKELTLLSGEMPDCPSFIFEMNSMLYVFCRTVRIFIVDKNFSVSEHIIEDTKLMYDAKYDLSEGISIDVPDNMIMYRVSVDYRARDAGITHFILPTECDTDYPVKITLISSGTSSAFDYTVDGKRLELGRTVKSAYNVSYVPAKGTQYRNFDKIFGCTCTCTYGGTSSGGTRVFFAGNEEYPGYYFHSELLSPLLVKCLSYDILGNGSENINGLAKQKSDLVAFCDRSIYRITYSFDEQDGPDFTVSEISTRIGCDIPNSIRLVDNRLVFASSGSGIHIIVSSEYTDELSIRRVSANVNGDSGLGFLYEDKQSVKESISADHDRKYMIVCPSGNAYVWDYGNSPYIATDDPLTAEKKLAWYLFDGIDEKMLFEMGGTLFGLRKNGEYTDIVYYSRDARDDLGKDIECIYRSRSFGPGDSFAKKVASEMFLNAVGDEGACVNVCFLCDGEKAASEDFTFTGNSDGRERIQRLYLALPGYEAYRVSFVLTGSKGRTGLYDAAIRFGRSGILYR